MSKFRDIGNTTLFVVSIRVGCYAISDMMGSLLSESLNLLYGLLRELMVPRKSRYVLECQSTDYHGSDGNRISNQNLGGRIRRRFPTGV